MNNNENEVKDKEEEYLDKINYLGNEMYQTLNNKQKNLWQRTISWQSLADYVKDKIRRYIEKKMKTLDLFIIILASIGLITNALQTMFYLNFSVLRSPDGFSIKISAEQSTFVEILRFITSSTTLLVIILIVFHYEVKKNFLIFKHEIPFNSSIFSKNLIIPMIIEIIVIAIHTPPYFNGMTFKIATTGPNSETVEIYADLLISVLILSRVYLLCKFYANYSKWGDVFASRVCNESNAKSGIVFTIKAGIKEHPFLSVIIVFILSIMILGYGFRNTEISFVKNMPHEYFQDWTHIENGFWFMCNTLLSIGYGDYYPTTILGRIIAFVACIWGILLESLLVIAITSAMDLNPKEEAAYNEIHQYLNDWNFRKRAMSLIYNYYKLNQELEAYEEATKDKEFVDEHRIKYEKELKKARKSLAEFTKQRLNRERINRQVTVQSLLSKINMSINDNMDYLLRSTKTEINRLLDNMNQTQENQNKILLFSGILDYMYKNMYDKIKGKKDEKAEEDKKDEKGNDFFSLFKK